MIDDDDELSLPDDDDTNEYDGETLSSMMLRRLDIESDRERRKREQEGRVSAAMHLHAWQRREALEDAEKQEILRRARRIARHQRTWNAATERKHRKEQRENDKFHTAYENQRATHAAAEQRRREHEAAERAREARRIAHEQALIEADRDPFAAHDAMMREAGHPDYLKPYDRIAAPLVSRSAEDGLVHKVTQNAPRPASVALPSRVEAKGDDAFLASCDELGVDPFFMDVICQTIGMSASDEADQRKRAIGTLRRRVERLEARIAELEGKEKSAPIDLPRLPRLRSVS
jgi:hypothetical protein